MFSPWVLESVTGIGDYAVLGEIGILRQRLVLRLVNQRRRIRARYLRGITRFGNQVVSGGNAVTSPSANSIIKKIGH